MPDPLQYPPKPEPWPIDQSIPVDEELVQQIIHLVDSSGANGVAKADIYALAGTGVDIMDIDNALAHLCNSTPQRVFWTGYDTARLVSVTHAPLWMQRVVLDLRNNPNPSTVFSGTYCAPRRWVDMYGTFLKADFERCVRGVMTILLTRPGISEVS